MSPFCCRKRVLLAFVVAAGIFAGCSEFKFVNQRYVETTEDSRLDIVLRGVRAEFTSGTTIQRRVASIQAAYNEVRGILVLTQPRIEAFTPEGVVEGTTRATTATMYLADQPAAKRRKGDFKLVGEVVHRIPLKTDPTSDSLILYTSSLGWLAEKELFVCDAPYRMTLFTLNRPPITALGDQFIATRDLRIWNVKHGALGTSLATDVREQHAQMRAQLEAAATAPTPARASSVHPMEIPPEMTAAEHTVHGNGSAPAQHAVPGKDATSGRRKLLRLPISKENPNGL